MSFFVRLLVLQTTLLYPMKIENIIEKRYMFKVEVKSFYSRNKDEVLKVVTLNDDEEIIKKYIPTRRHIQSMFLYLVFFQFSYL